MKKTNLIVIPLIAIMLFISLCGCSNGSENYSYGGSVVYVTRTGSKYHRSNCRYLSESKIEMYLDEAQENGYSRCSVCKPPTE